jgi:hypothetical protein
MTLTMNTHAAIGNVQQMKYVISKYIFEIISKQKKKKKNPTKSQNYEKAQKKRKKKASVV